MRDKLFLDTNILVYLVNEDSPFHSRVLDRFRGLLEEHEPWISRQVIREYIVVMTRPGTLERPLSSEEVVQDIEGWLNSFHIADESDEVTRNLLELIRDHKITGKRVHDANIVATMRTHLIRKLYTVNTGDFSEMGGVEIVSL